MSEQLGQVLRGWREQRGLSLGALATRAGVAKGTLSGWERGLHEPRLPELAAILAAIEATPDHWREALALIRAPRAQRSLAQSTFPLLAGVKAADRPAPGHLLRALRLRRGLTLEHVAREVGVDRATLSRWERSLNTPPAGRLQRLLDLLEARPQERTALMAGGALPLTLAGDGPSSLALLEERINALGSRVTRGDRALLDLEFLAWQAEVWPRAASTGAARELLGWGWAKYASWLTWEGRHQEGGSYAERAMGLTLAEGRRTPRFLSIMATAVHIIGLIIAHGTTRDAKVAAVEWLQSWLPEAAGTDWEVVLYRDMAENAWWAGQRDAAHSWAERACRLAEQCENEEAKRLCRDVRADLYFRSGQPEEALALLSPPEAEGTPVGQIQEALRWVQVLRAMGERTAAADRLAEAYALIERYGYPDFRVSADTLAREL